MTIFVSIAALLTLSALAWLVRPLLWPALWATTQAGVLSQNLNASIYRDQIEALERDVAFGVLTAADKEASRNEIRLRLLDDAEEPAAPLSVPGTGLAGQWRIAAAIALLLTLGATGMYWRLGTPSAVEAMAIQQPRDEQAEQMVATMAARLKANPDNPNGWAMLARYYKGMGRLAEAEQAFLKAGDLLDTQPDVMVDYADLLAARAGNNIEGKPLELVNKALALDPRHPMGLMMSAAAAYRRSDFGNAVMQWEKLLTVLAPGSPDFLQVEASIANARAKAGMPPAVKPTATSKLPPVDPAMAGNMTPEKINQMVERLAERMKSSPDDLAGWARLAQAYKVQGRLPEAEEAYARAGKLVDRDPDLLTQYADLLAVRGGNRIEGRSLALVNKALALNPKHPLALRMAGFAAFHRADYAQAAAYWEAALAVLPAGSSDAARMASQIAVARAKGGIGPQSATKP